MEKPVSCRVSLGDYWELKRLAAEYETNMSDIFRSAIYREMHRMKEQSEEDRMEEIKDNAHWEKTKQKMKESRG